MVENIESKIRTNMRELYETRTVKVSWWTNVMCFLKHKASHFQPLTSASTRRFYVAKKRFRNTNAGSMVFLVTAAALQIRIDSMDLSPVFLKQSKLQKPTEDKIDDGFSTKSTGMNWNMNM
jgi:hypothetical protein